MAGLICLVFVSVTITMQPWMFVSLTVVSRRLYPLRSRIAK
jgi:hypothetical protein